MLLRFDPLIYPNVVQFMIIWTVDYGPINVIDVTDATFNAQYRILLWYSPRVGTIWLRHRRLNCPTLPTSPYFQWQSKFVNPIILVSHPCLSLLNNLCMYVAHGEPIQSLKLTPALQPWLVKMLVGLQNSAYMPMIAI